MVSFKYPIIRKLRGAGHRLKSLLSSSFSPSSRDAIDATVPTSPPPILPPMMPTELITIVLPPSPPTIVENAQRAPTPNPDGLSPNTNIPPRLAGHAKIPRPLETIKTHTNLVPVNPEDPKSSSTPGDRAPRSRALLIGVHYTGQRTGWGELHTPGDDVRKMRDLLRSRGYTEFKTIVDTNDPERDEMPTNEGIRKGLRWLMDDVRSGDRLFLHYSGHGDQVPTDDTNESDGQNEAIVPLTPHGAIENLIIDDELHAILVKPLPHGCTLIALFDCCHSGTMLDLSHNFPQYRLTRRDLKNRLVKDWQRIRRLAHPARLAHSLPTPVIKRTSTPSTTSDPAQAPAKAPVRGGTSASTTPAQGQGKTPDKAPVRRGTANPLKLPHVVNMNALPLTPPATAQPYAPLSFGNPNPSTENTPLIHPHAPFVDEPRGSSAGSHSSSLPQSQRSTGSDSVAPNGSGNASGGVDTPRAGIPTPPNSAGRWLQHDYITATPMSAAFPAFDIAPPSPVPMPPLVRDFQTQRKAYTQIRSPTLEETEPLQATVIAIAACLDEEEAIDINHIGGLLTSTFIACMQEPAHLEGVSLGNMIAYFGKCFKRKMNWLHSGHPPSTEGKCSRCLLPVNAPKPLVTSSMKLMHDARIVL